MNQEIKDRIAKVYELVNKGSTEGEREAAKKALDRIMKKYNLDDSILEEVGYKKRVFKWAKQIELTLLERIMAMMVPDSISKSYRSGKSVVSNIDHGDWITIDCAYEYFRRHMKKEYNRLVLPELKKKKKAKTKNKRRAQLTELFMTNYIIASNLYKPEELVQIDVSDSSDQELKDRAKMRGVEGGAYNRQVVGGLMLEA